MKTNRDILAKFISTQGYKRNSPDKNRPFNIIPSGNITMQDVDFPVYGVDNLGNEQLMMPGAEYTFPGDYVVETPMAQTGGTRPPIFTSNPKDPRIQSYNDSLNVYNQSETLNKKFRNFIKTNNLLVGEYIPYTGDKIEPIKGTNLIFQGNGVNTTGVVKADRKTTIPYDKNFINSITNPKSKSLASMLEYKKPVQPVKFRKVEKTKPTEPITPIETPVTTTVEPTPTPKVERKVLSVEPEEVKAGTKTTSGKQIGSGTAGGRIYRVKYDNGETEILNEFEYRSRRLKKQNGGQTGWLDEYQAGGTQMYPAPSLEFQKRVQDNIRTNSAQPVSVEKEPLRTPNSIISSLNAAYDNTKTSLNPFNWGVTDYTNTYSDKNQAFAAARKAGEKEYLYKGVRYTTDIKDEKRPESSFTLSREERQKIYNSVNPVYYPKDEIVDAVKRYVGNKNFKDDVTQSPNLEVENRKSIADEDAWAFFMGIPQQKNSVSVSKYKPTTTTDKNAEYYTLRNAYPYFSEFVIDNASTAFKHDKVRDLLGRKTSELKSKNSNTITGAYSDFMPLENVTFSKGKDERGDYYSIYDIYDFSIPFEGKIGKPYEVYDRVYYKDYGDGKNKPMYYTDKELSELNVNKKNFDTLMLQKELVNRGYELPKSTTKKGELDGKLGDETRAALLDLQLYTNNKKMQSGGQQQMYPGPSLQFQQQVKNFVNKTPNTFVRREPVTVSQSDNTRTNAVEDAKRTVESYSKEDIKYFLDNNIPKERWGIEKVKMQEQAVLRAREAARNQSREDVKNNPFAITKATNANLRNEFRAFPNDPNSFFDEYLNPAQMIGNLAANLGDNFTGEQPIDPWKVATDVVTPAFVGMTAGIGAQNTGQFANNLINPLAGIRNPLARRPSNADIITERMTPSAYPEGTPLNEFGQPITNPNELDRLDRLTQRMRERASQIETNTNLFNPQAPGYNRDLLAADYTNLINGYPPNSTFMNYPNLTREEVVQTWQNLNNRLQPPPSEIHFMPDGTTRDIYTQQPQPVMPTILGGIDIRRPINGHAPGTTEWNRLNDILHSRANQNYKPKIVNRSGLTKEEALQKVTSKDKDTVSKMSETEFQNTVLKPDGQIAEYKPDPLVEQMMFDRTTGRNVLKDQTVLSEAEYADAFNSQLDLLNSIIKRRNKSGIDYRVKGLNPNTGKLQFETPAQTVPSSISPKAQEKINRFYSNPEEFLKKEAGLFQDGNVWRLPDEVGGDVFNSIEEAIQFTRKEIDDIAKPTTISGESTWGVRLNPGKWKGNVEDLPNTEYLRSIPGIEMSNTTAGVFSDHVARKGTGAYESINEYLKALDLGRVKPGFNSQTDYSRGAWENFIKSGRGVGFYANPRTIYGTMKTLAPIGVGVGVGASLNTRKTGGQTNWLDEYE